MEESIKLTGKVHVQLFDEHGNLKQEHTDHNLIVTVGKHYLMDWLAAASQTTPFMAYVAAGTNASPSTSNMTTLGAELTGGGNTRALGVVTSNMNTWNNTATFSPGNYTGILAEVGLFSASSAGTMLARQAFTAYTKISTDTLIINWTLTLS